MTTNKRTAAKGPETEATKAASTPGDWMNQLAPLWGNMAQQMAPMMGAVLNAAMSPTPAGGASKPVGLGAFANGGGLGGMPWASMGASQGMPRMDDVLKSFQDLKMDPGQFAAIQSDFIRDATKLWQDRVTETIGAPFKDKRFSSDAWREPMMHFTAAWYLLNARTLMRMAEAVEGDNKSRARIRFSVQQWVDAAAPSNFLAFNADALKKAIETKGESLTTGLGLLLKDLQQGHVSQTDESGFEVGRNVATTEGAVVFENELFQLIEYKPLTDKIFERPMLFVPPCINKFYIMDLQPKNSLIRYTVEQGHRVFVVSWRNPDKSMASKTWDDYINDGPLKAIEVVKALTGSKDLNTLGFCVGGTILTTALAVLAARGDFSVSSATLLTTFLDFSDTGILDLFIDEGGVRLRETTIGAEAPGGPGMLSGRDLATTFSFLRPNDLVWNYVVGNYLKGEMPPPFDLLYWNSDSTNLPGPMYCWYLRNTYLENNLKVPGKVTVCGESIDLGKIKSPFYLYSSREDHIVPWDGAYRSAAILKSPTRFVMGASGHIAGVINPPAAGKRSHWTNDKLAPTAEEWLSNATETPGSWWPDWSNWLAGYGGKQKAAPKAYGGKGFDVIEAAPGRYVKQKA